MYVTYLAPHSFVTHIFRKVLPTSPQVVFPTDYIDFTMKFSLVSFLALVASAYGHGEGGQMGPAPVVERMVYDDNGFNLTGFVSMPAEMEDGAKLPVVVIIP